MTDYFDVPQEVPELGDKLIKTVKYRKDIKTPYGKSESVCEFDFSQVTPDDLKAIGKMTKEMKSKSESTTWKKKQKSNKIDPEFKGFLQPK